MLSAGTVGTTLHPFLNPYWGGGYARGLCPQHEEGCGRQSLGGGHSLSGRCTVGDPWDPYVIYDGVHVIPGNSMHGMVMQGEDLWGGITPTQCTPTARGIGHLSNTTLCGCPVWGRAAGLLGGNSRFGACGESRRLCEGACARACMQECMCARGHVQTRQREYGHMCTAACTKQQGSAHVWARLGLHLH